jgi:hypothetical protein
VWLEARAAELAVEDLELGDRDLMCLGVSRPQARDDESQDRADDQVDERKQRELLGLGGLIRAEP